MNLVTNILIIFEIVGNVSVLICVPIIIKFISKRKEWHIYYRIIFSSLVVACTIHSISSLVIYVVIFYINFVPVIGNNFKLSDTYSLSRLFLKGSCGAVRVCIWTMAIERTFATINRKNYEEYHNMIIPIILIILPFGYGYNIDNIGNVWPFFKKNYVKFCMAFDCIILFVLIVLWLLNRKLHQLHSKKMLTLSEKFQISENIRLSKISLPVTILFVLDNYAFNFIFAIVPLTLTEDEFITLINYGSLSYCYTFFFIFTLYQYKEKFNILNFIGRNKVNNLQNNDTASKTNVNSLKQEKLQSLKIVNANNNLIPMQYDQKSYFKVYENAW